MGFVSRRFCGWVCLAGVGCRNVILFLTLLCLRITSCGIILRSFSVAHLHRRWVLLFSGGRRGVRGAFLASWLSSAPFSGFHERSGDQGVAGPCRDFLAVLPSPVAPSPTGSVLLTSDCISSSFCTLESVLEGNLAGHFEGGTLALTHKSEFAKLLLFPQLETDSRAFQWVAGSVCSAVPTSMGCLLPRPASCQASYDSPQVLWLSWVPLWHSEGHGGSCHLVLLQMLFLSCLLCCPSRTVSVYWTVGGNSRWLRNATTSSKRIVFKSFEIA